ncbi:hypothetical protein KUTeg_012778 [Tegillarca granosa]|uniref:GFO/IDH/MocA-like oxidoreductase domain-containing protein n=1 Tax=Tegillarca granosa TaxID=220873 RepID=A0ABQ9F0I3_TEGGR|nr:hypothetical protein KUTeg_012778 [Tegillarca granosa]
MERKIRRFDPVFEKMYEAAHSGLLGDLQVIKLTTRDSPKPSYEFLKNADPSGCNIISDLAVHDIDLSVWLTGSQEPESVYVVTHCHDDFLKTIDQPDTLAMVLKYKNGIITTMDVSRDSAYGYDIRIELFGSKGMATAENPRQLSSVIDVSDGGKMTPYHHSFPQRFEKAFENEITHFVDCLDGKTTPLVTKSQCLIVAGIIEKAVKSYKENRPIRF